MKNNCQRMFLVMVVVLFAVAAYGEQGIHWEQLRPEDQKVLKPFAAT